MEKASKTNPAVASPIATPKRSRAVDSLDAEPKRQRLSSPSHMAPDSPRNPTSPSHSEGDPDSFLRDDSYIFMRRRAHVEAIREILKAESETAFIYSLNAEDVQKKAEMAAAEAKLLRAKVDRATEEAEIAEEKVKIVEKEAKIAKKKTERQERRVELGHKFFCSLLEF